MAGDSSGIMGIFGTISSLLKNAFKPPKRLKSIPTELILFGTQFRSGLSAIDIASKIIERKKEIGVTITPLPSGGKNIDLQMEVIRVEEILNALTTNAVIEIAIPPGMLVSATGPPTAPGLPIIVQGATTSLTKAKGIIR
jgi:hypothetical protein